MVRFFVLVDDVVDVLGLCVVIVVGCVWMVDYV